MKKMKTRTWNNDELSIAYYIANYGLVGLDIKDIELRELMTLSKTSKSFESMVQDFKNILSDSNVFPISKTCRDFVKNTRDSTMTQVRNKVSSVIESLRSDMITYNKKESALKVSERTKRLNDDLQFIFDNKLIGLRKHRNLRKK